MPRSLARASICAFTFLAAACQPRTKTKVVTVTVPEAEPGPGTELVDFKKQAYGTPLPVSLSDPSCATRAEAETLVSAAVEGAFYGYAETNEQNIAITTRILDAHTYEQELSNKTDSRFTLQGDRQALMVCGTPNAGSVEYVGLKLQKAVDDSYAFYRSVQGAASALKLPDLPGLGIGLYPQYKKDVKRLEETIRPNGTKTQNATQTITVQTDNAFYSPFADDTLSTSIYAISLIPQSAEARQYGYFDGKGLWEFPVVFHHEYGHHVFQVLFGDSTVVSFRDYLSYWQKHRSLHAIHGILGADDRSGDPSAARERQAFLASPGYVFGALNEGFADLFAFYSLGGDRDLFNIACFQRTRNILDDKLYNGIPKIWDDSLWQETFDINARLGAGANADATPVERCSQPSFDDIHVMGAIIAHTVDAVFNTTVDARADGVSPALFKAGLLLQWIQDLRASDEVLELSQKQTLSRILNVALGTGLKALGNKGKTEFCGVVRAKFPALLTRWAGKPAEDAAGVSSLCQPDE